MMCKLKEGMNKGGHYDVDMKGWIQKGGIIRCRLKRQMDKGVMMLKERVDGKGGIYQVHFKRGDEQVV